MNVLKNYISSFWMFHVGFKRRRYFLGDSQQVFNTRIVGVH